MGATSAFRVTHRSLLHSKTSIQDDSVVARKRLQTIGVRDPQASASPDDRRRLLGGVGWYAVNGLLVLFPGAGWSIVATAIAVESGQLFVAGYVAHTWNGIAWPLRIALSGVVVMLSVLTNAGVYSALVRAHEAGHTAAVIELNRDAVQLAQQIAIEEGAMRDLDNRIAQRDDIVRAATSKGNAGTAPIWPQKQDKARAQLVTRRQAIAERIAKLREEQAGIEARKARTSAELGPALAIARLFGSGDVDGAIRVVCLLLVLAMDPLSLLLVFAASRRRG
jgi:hypothetical protein